MFDAPLDSKVVRVKVQFYLGKFAAYFLAILVVLSLLDYSKVGKRTVKMLHDSAYKSEVYIPSQTSHASHGKEEHGSKSSIKQSKEVFSKLKRKDCAIQAVIDHQHRFNELSADHNAAMPSKMLQSNRLLLKESGYSEGFYTYIDQRRTYLGCEPLLYPDGTVQVCDNVVASTEKGVLEDLVIFLCNNHSLLNCVFAVDGAPVDRFGNRLIYTTQNCIAFFLSAVSGSVFAYCGITSKANIVFDIVVTTPATIVIATVIKTLYTCPVGFSVDYQVKNPLMVKVVRVLGKLTLVPIVVSIFVLLVLATIFSRGHDYIMLMVSFFLQVQLYGFFLELVVTVLMFMSRFYMRCSIDLHVRSIVVFEVGRRYTEFIYHNGLVEGKDYHYRCYYSLCVLRVECIYRFDDAVKKGYVTEGDRFVIDDIELTTNSSLHAFVGTFSYDNKQEEDDADLRYDTYGRMSVVPAEQSPMQSRSNATTSNPLHSTNTATTCNPFFSSNYATTNIDIAARINTAQVVEEDDECDIPVARAMSVDDEDNEYDYSLSEEENLQRRRKEFKPQTRTSFVATFRKFEESEQLATTSSVGSEKRIDFLHNSLKKSNNNRAHLLAPKR